jgi:hypothetical protein
MLFLSAAAGRGNQAEDDGLANKKLLYFCEISLSTHFPVRFSASGLRGATQKLLRYFLRSFKHMNTDGQPRRNAPFPHAREIRSRLIQPSQTIAILRGTRDIFALQLRQPRKK